MTDDEMKQTNQELHELSNVAWLKWERDMREKVDLFRLDELKELGEAFLAGMRTSFLNGYWTGYLKANRKKK